MTGTIRAPRLGTGSGSRRAALALAAGCLLAAAARAELVVLVDGAVLKVESYEARGEIAALGFPGGGLLEMAIERVERVVDDEIEPVRPGRRRWGERRGGVSGPLREWPVRPRHALVAARSSPPRSGTASTPSWWRRWCAPSRRFDPRAVSRKGARGLMQLMPATGRRFGLSKSEMFDPAKNLDAGARYLAWLVGPVRRRPGAHPRRLQRRRGRGRPLRRRAAVPRDARLRALDLSPRLGLRVARPSESGTASVDDAPR